MRPEKIYQKDFCFMKLQVIFQKHCFANTFKQKCLKFVVANRNMIPIFLFGQIFTHQWVITISVVSEKSV